MKTTFRGGTRLPPEGPGESKPLVKLMRPSSKFFPGDSMPRSNQQGRRLVSVKDFSLYPAKCVLRTTRAPDRSRILYAALLPSFVVVATQMGNGYAWNLETHKEHWFKLPNSSIRGMHGSGNLVAISLKDWIVVHDVQVQKTSSFKNTQSDIRVWDGEEIRAHYQRGVIIVNPGKKIVWTTGQTPRDGHWLLIADGIYLEKEAFVQRDIHELPHRSTPAFSCNGPRILLEHESCGCLPGESITQQTTHVVEFHSKSSCVLVQDDLLGRLLCYTLPREAPARLVLQKNPGSVAGENRGGPVWKLVDISLDKRFFF